MERHRPHQITSTESVGYFGTVDQILRVNEYGLTEGYIDGFELMAFRPAKDLQAVVNRIENEQLMVSHFHGRTGGYGRDVTDSVKLIGANWVIVPSDHMIEHMANGKGVLFHTPEVTTRAVREKLASVPDISKVWVENHHGDRAIPDMLNMIQALRMDGVPASGMFDLCHYIGADALTDPKQFTYAYWNMIDTLEWLLTNTDKEQQQLIEGVHIPTGPNADDSLPMHILKQNPEMLQRLGEVIRGKLTCVVVEHQEDFISKNFYLLPHQVKNQARMKRDAIMLLADTGVLLPQRS